MSSLESLPDVPDRSPLRGHLPALRADRLGLFDQAMHTAPLTKLYFFRRDALVVTSPEAAHDLLVDHGKRTRKTPGLRVLLSLIGGEGLFTSEGELWRRQRRLMAPLFQPASIGRYGEVMTTTARDIVRTWPVGGRINLLQEFARIAMNVVGRALFGNAAFDDADELGHSITTLLDWVNRGISSTGLVINLMGVQVAEAMLPTLRQRAPKAAQRVQRGLHHPWLVRGARSAELRQAKQVLDARLLSLITARRERPDAQDDLLSRLLGARDDDGSMMSDEQLRDEAATLFIAGHETTANALSWTMALLARHPQWLAKVLDEVHAHGPTAFTFADVAKLPVTIRAFKEAMRLYPPLTVLVRQATEPFSLAGYDVPKGHLLFAPVWSIHRNPAAWPDPLTFDPDRFTPENEAKRHRGAWLPFGIGQRVCIGSHFAMLEGPLVLATMLQHCQLEVETASPLEREEFATLRPKHGVWATVTAHR